MQSASLQKSSGTDSRQLKTQTAKERKFTTGCSVVIPVFESDFSDFFVEMCCQPDFTQWAFLCENALE